MKPDGQRPPASLRSSHEEVVQARWLIPDGRTLLSPGCLHIRDGRIVRVCEGADAGAHDLGEVAIVPGLINAHTHLEFSDLSQPLAPGATFPIWIREVVRLRRGRSEKFDLPQVIGCGWEESAATGSVAIGEIATVDATIEFLSRYSARGVVFREYLGLQGETVPQRLAEAGQFLASSALSRTSLLRGLSPHAPYSLHPALFRGLIGLAVEAGAPVAMHLAETREEIELLAHHRGGLVDLLVGLGLWRSDLFEEFRRPLDYLRELTRCSRALVVHGNYLDEVEQTELEAAPHLSVVYCPRTHAAFGHGMHPWRRLRERGVRVVIGTDSRASNPDLSMVSELRWLQARAPEVPAGDLLQMATRDAAAALGLAHDLGELAPGKLAQWTVLHPKQPLTSQSWQGLFG